MENNTSTNRAGTDEKWSPEMRACWDRLGKHEFDHPTDALSFLDRLARDNDWEKHFAAQVIEEYRRFCFLAVHAGHPVTPSDAVDQAWHLHLSYSRNYFETFCPDVLGKTLHHDPTKGGPEEDVKYRFWYQQTLESYAEKFNTPNPDIWPKLTERFADVDLFKRLNTKEFRMVRHQSIGLAALVSVVVSAILMMFALGGSDFAHGFFLSFGMFTVMLTIAALPDRRGDRSGMSGGSAMSVGGGGCGGGGGG